MIDTTTRNKVLHLLVERLGGHSTDVYNLLTKTTRKGFSTRDGRTIALDELIEAAREGMRDTLPPTHVVLEQAEMMDGTGRVAQTVSIGPEGSGEEYQRIVHSDEAIRPPYVTTTSGMRGFFAVLVDGNNSEPIQTGFGSYKDSAGAAKEGKDWAEAEGLEFRP